ncbi:MAG: hypothetical protein ABC585_03975 [Candidatus Methanosuratincola petrocarbonis]|nr:hypothetical protein [Candidatus Methanosuratincola sp.]
MDSRMRPAALLHMRGWSKGGKGVALIFDCMVACVIIIAGLAAYSSVATHKPPGPDEGLGKYATDVLTFLDSNGCLARLIEGRDSLALRKTIGELLPEGANYCLCVYSPYWELEWSFSSQGFDWRNAAASSPYLVFSESKPEPYMVTLSISK